MTIDYSQLYKDAQEQAKKAFSQVCNLLEMQHVVKFDALERDYARVGNVTIRHTLEGSHDTVPVLIVDARKNYLGRNTRKGAHVFRGDPVKKVGSVIKAFLDELAVQNKILERLEREREIKGTNEAIIEDLGPGADDILRPGSKPGQFYLNLDALQYRDVTTAQGLRLLEVLRELDLLPVEKTEKTEEETE